MDDIHALIGTIYDAALDEARWPIVAAQMASVFNATSALVQRPQADGGVLLVTAGAARGYNSPDYAAYYWKRDIWVKAGLAAGVGRTITTADVGSDREFERSEFYNEVCRKLDLFHIIGKTVALGQRDVATVAVHRPRNAGRFDADETDLFEIITPHLQRALRIKARLQGAVTALTDIPGLAGGGGVMVVTAGGVLLAANAQAEALLGRNETLLCRHNTVTLSQAGLASRLAAMILRAARMTAESDGGIGGRLAVPRGGKRLPLFIDVAPYRAACSPSWPEETLCMVVVRDPEMGRSNVQCLREIFGLSGAEAVVAAAVANGRTPHEIARDLGVSINTIRTHLKQIFAKTGTGRQSQIAALVIRVGG